MFKRFLLFSFILILFIGCFSTPSARAAGDVGIFMDGVEVSIDSSPQITQSRVMVPFRAVAESMGVAVIWDADMRTVTANGLYGQVVMQIDNSTATVGGVEHTLDSPPVIHDSRTLIPLRFFSESLGAQVEWRQDTRDVYITSPLSQMEVMGYYALGDGATSSWTDLFGKQYPEHNPNRTGLFSRVILGWYGLDSSGALLTQTNSGYVRPEGWENVLSALDQYGIAGDMMVFMSDGNYEVTSLLESEAAMQRAVDNIAREAQAYSGVNLDLEGLGMSQTGEELLQVRNSFNQFVSLLSSQLKDSGKKLSLSLHPLNSSFAGYDYATLGRLADSLIIMAYDYTPVGQPEPVERVREAVRLALEQVGPEKVVLGISLASENQSTLPGKISIAKANNLKGIALWRLGIVGDGNFSVLNNHVVRR